jgi:hypothetical protein
MERASTGVTRFDADRFFKIFGQWDPWRVARRRRCRDMQGVPLWASDQDARCGVVAVWLKRW